jgi:DNA-directed RNA polymerase specialized sigma24 family protein
MNIISEEIVRCKTIIQMIINKKLNYKFDYYFEDAYHDSIIDLLQTNNIGVDDVFGILIRLTWNHIADETNRVDRKYHTDDMDVFEFSDADTNKSMVLDFTVKKKNRIEYNTLPHIDKFLNSLHPVQRSIVQMRMDKLTNSEIHIALKKDRKYLSSMEFAIRKKYSEWLPVYLKNIDKYTKNLNKIKNEKIRSVAELVIEEHSLKDIVKITGFNSSSSAAYRHYARRMLGGETTKIYELHTHIPKKNRLRVLKKPR